MNREKNCLKYDLLIEDDKKILNAKSNQNENKLKQIGKT